MAAKSLGTASAMASSVVSRQTKGSNHIWKTSSGKRALKSHFTVSQRLGERDTEDMVRQDWTGLFTLRWPDTLSARWVGPHLFSSLRQKLSDLGYQEPDPKNRFAN